MSYTKNLTTSIDNPSNLSSDVLTDRTILLTGGTGSFGQAFVTEALKHSPSVIRIFSRGEYLQWEMAHKFNNDPRLRFFVGDVRDRERVYRAMAGAHIIVHAAALKQIPSCEYNPIEAIKTNVLGAINIIDAAIDQGVEKVIAISSDKAIHPINLYGATKLCMEKLIIHANVYTGTHKTRFSCVRYGNVMGSRGSVVPLFQTQKLSRVLTITDEKMTRFWITLEQGVRFVIDCLGRMQGWEIFVPKLPSIRIVDLAQAIAPDAKQVTVGIRPAEKLHEILIPEEEAERVKEFENYFVVHPPFSTNLSEEGRALAPGSQYSSDRNWFLNMDEIRELLKIADGK